MKGGGKHEAEVQRMILDTNTQGAFVLFLDGGTAWHAEAHFLEDGQVERVPAMLRAIADMMDADFAKELKS